MQGVLPPLPVSLCCVFQLLACSDLPGDKDDFLGTLLMSLRSQCRVMRGLALRGLVLLCKRQEMVSRGQPGEAVQAAWGWPGDAVDILSQHQASHLQTVCVARVLCPEGASCCEVEGEPERGARLWAQAASGARGSSPHSAEATVCGVPPWGCLRCAAASVHKPWVSAGPWQRSAEPRWERSLLGLGLLTGRAGFQTALVTNHGAHSSLAEKRATGQVQRRLCWPLLPPYAPDPLRPMCQ